MKHISVPTFSAKTHRRLKRLALIGAVAIVVSVQPAQDPIEYINRPFVNPMIVFTQFCILLLFCCLVTLIYLTWQMFNPEEAHPEEVQG